MHQQNLSHSEKNMINKIMIFFFTYYHKKCQSHKNCPFLQLRNKGYGVTIYLKVESLVISTSNSAMFYGQLLLLFHDCTKLFLLKCSIWPINCPKFPRQNEQTSVIVSVVGCVCVCKTGKETQRRWQRKGEEEGSLLGRKVSPVWVSFCVGLFGSIFFKGSIIQSGL